MPDRSITIWESYVGRGAPSNQAGSRRGYGLTKEAAHAAAAHWANQAPWARARRVTVTDQSARTSELHTRDEEIAWGVCGIPDTHAPASRLEQECIDLIRRGKFATAILRVLEPATRTGRHRR